VGLPALCGATSEPRPPVDISSVDIFDTEEGNNIFAATSKRTKARRIKPPNFTNRGRLSIKFFIFSFMFLFINDYFISIKIITLLEQKEEHYPGWKIFFGMIQ
jgi:hypothetical protein